LDIFIEANSKFLVMGAGMSGLSASELLVDLKAKVTIADRQNIQNLGPKAQALSSKVDFIGEDDLGEKIKDFDIVIVSPGIAKKHPAVTKAKRLGLLVIGEMELAFRYIDIPVLAVTGTNGKTTVTDLTGFILRDRDMEVFVGGNIGNPLSNLALAKRRGEADKVSLAVLEVSSFQLETIETFRAKTAALLNLTPDHLDRHGSMEEYFKIKSRIFKNQKSADLSVINMDDELVRNVKTKGQVFFFSRKQKPVFGAYVANKTMKVVMDGLKVAQAPCSDFAISGKHNMENIMAAIGLTYDLGVAPQDVMESAAKFTLGDHRLKSVAEINDVLFVDDSKGTNVGAVAAALSSFKKPIILIMGGRDKDLDFSYLAKKVKKKVKELILIGESRTKIEESLGSLVPTKSLETMAEAVKAAYAAAESGDVVLLSPACASFDMFRDYKERGQIFSEEVLKLKRSLKKKKG
ncbi:MAG: UDP-N-acetylmuramoyl-L-alanine--D-glutamate ligase, partial [Deltaproteobacteria bacterium]|nr:UDP-N-acetylmuramoyl-L-alanine--D-glutamate ligase [Deltaproteobacteria bacterium]